MGLSVLSVSPFGEILHIYPAAKRAATEVNVVTITTIKSGSRDSMIPPAQSQVGHDEKSVAYN